MKIIPDQGCFSNEEGKKRGFNDMTKHIFLASFVWFFLFFPPCTGSAQTPPTESVDADQISEVAVMAFIGDDAAANTLLRDAVVKEVQGVGRYTPWTVSGEDHPEILGLRPDEPPDTEYLGASQYALTGEFYTDPIGSKHLQLWLWNSGDGSLVYTDERITRDIEEALSYMPAMIIWVFSRIPGNAIFGLQHDSKPDPLNNWLYAGMRGGGSFRSYTLPESTKDHYSRALVDLSYEASFQAAFKFLPFMSVQAEAVFTQDRAKLQGSGYENEGGASWHTFYTDSYTSTSLLFPLTVKFPLVIDPYVISPFCGAYWTLSLGSMMLDSNISTRKTGEFDYDLTGRFGLTAGVDLGIRLGPGILFLDTRYDGDFGETVTQMDDGTEIHYKRAMLSISIGYELGLVKKRR
jgi:hypothetical protein